MNLLQLDPHSQKLINTLVSPAESFISNPLESSEWSNPWLVQSFWAQNPTNLVFSQDQFFSEFLKTLPKRKKASRFKLNLQHRRKLRSFYGGISTKYLEKALRESGSKPGQTSKNLISLLERRVDVSVYRSQFAKTLRSARQLISHKKVYVNSQLCTYASLNLNPGDCISLHPSMKTKVFQTPTKTPAVNSNLSKLNKFDGVIGSRNFSHSQLTYLGLALLKIIEIQNQIATEKIVCENQPSAWDSLYSFSSKIQKGFSECSPAFTRFIPQYLKTESLRFPSSQVERLELMLGQQTYLTKQSKLRNSASSLSQHGMKPLNFEMSYKCLTLCYLYTPQRVYYPFLMDWECLEMTL